MSEPGGEWDYSEAFARSGVLRELPNVLRYGGESYLGGYLRMGEVVEIDRDGGIITYYVPDADTVFRYFDYGESGADDPKQAISDTEALTDELRVRLMADGGNGSGSAVKAIQTFDDHEARQYRDNAITVIGSAAMAEKYLGIVARR